MNKDYLLRGQRTGAIPETPRRVFHEDCEVFLTTRLEKIQGKLYEVSVYCFKNIETGVVTKYESHYILLGY